MKGKLIKTEEGWMVGTVCYADIWSELLPLYEETFDPNTKLPIIPLEDGKQVEFEIINVYVSPPDSIHCNRGAFADYARLIKEYPELEGTMNLCEEIIQKRTGKMTEEEWQAAERMYSEEEVKSAFKKGVYRWNEPIDMSAEEIEKAANDYFKDDGQCNMVFERFAFKMGIKWYREQLKNKL